MKFTKNKFHLTPLFTALMFSMMGVSTMASADYLTLYYKGQDAKEQTLIVDSYDTNLLSRAANLIEVGGVKVTTTFNSYQENERYGTKRGINSLRAIAKILALQASSRGNATSICNVILATFASSDPKYAKKTAKFIERSIRQKKSFPSDKTTFLYNKPTITVLKGKTEDEKESINLKRYRSYPRRGTSTPPVFIPVTLPTL